MARFIEIEAKSILTKHKFRDDWFWDRYAINPYRGCQFACNYCDAITENIWCIKITRISQGLSM